MSKEDEKYDSDGIEDDPVPVKPKVAAPGGVASSTNSQKQSLQKQVTDLKESKQSVKKSPSPPFKIEGKVEEIEDVYAEGAGG
jgi:hypothetical protein